MQISIQKLIDNEASKEKIAAAMLENFEDHLNIFSDGDEPLKIFCDFDFLENFLITDTCKEYDFFDYKTIILKIDDFYFSWEYSVSPYKDCNFYRCQKVIPVKKMILDVDFIPVFPDYKTKKETETYKKIFQTGL